MTPYPHQIALAEVAYDVLAENMIAYLAMEERTGKTLTAVLVCEMAAVQSILVITKKKALDGWHETLAKFKHLKSYTVTNYHQVKKYGMDYDLVILDEAHNYLSAFPKSSSMWDEVKAKTKGKPIIYISATPYAQGTQGLYHQFALSDWSPFKKWSSGYSWFKTFGIPETVYLSGRQVETYKKVETDDVLMYCKHLFVKATRQELGFEHEPEDKIHYIELAEATREVYNIMVAKKALELNSYTLELDTTMKLRTTLHMLEGGVMKVNNEYVVLGNKEKINYILDNWGDTDDLAIMYQYKAEQTKLQACFKKALILQATSFAEGVDLSHIKHLVVYSQDFSTARHSQRRARQANKNRDEEIVVHFLLVKGGVSEQVYTTVSVNKTNFIDSLFQETTL